jgi:hypothetical protein
MPGRKTSKKPITRAVSRMKEETPAEHKKRAAEAKMNRGRTK